MSIKNLPWNVVKAALFALALYFILRQFHLADLAPALRLFTMPALFGLCLLQILRYVLLALRWRYACRIQGIDIPLLWFIKSEFEILFLEFALPFPDAEDVFRILFLKAKYVPVSKSMTASLMLRVCGLGTMSVLLLGLIMEWGNLMPGNISGNMVLAGVLSVVVLTGIFLHRFILRKSAPIVSKIPKIGKRLGDILKQISETPISTVQYGIAVLYTFLHLGCIALSLFLLLSVCGYPVNFFYLLLLVPLFLLSFLLPVSVQGFGLPEATMLFVLPMFGVPQAIAAAVALVHLAGYSLLILYGGILVWLSNADKWTELKL